MACCLRSTLVGLLAVGMVSCGTVLGLGDYGDAPGDAGARAEGGTRDVRLGSDGEGAIGDEGQVMAADEGAEGAREGGALPVGWALVAFADAPQGTCPTGFTTNPTAVVFGNGAPGSGACSCETCTVTAQPSCVTGPIAITYDPEVRVLTVGPGTIAPVEPASWAYEVAGRKIVKRWFDARRRDPDGRRSSPLDDIVATSWNPDWTTELLELLSVLTLLVDLEPAQAELLERIMAGPIVTVDDFVVAGVGGERPTPGTPAEARSGRLFDLNEGSPR